MKEQIEKGLFALLATGQDSDTVSEILKPFLPADHYVRCEGRIFDVYRDNGGAGEVVASFQLAAVVTTRRVL